MRQLSGGSKSEFCFRNITGRRPCATANAIEWSTSAARCLGLREAADSAGANPLAAVRADLEMQTAESVARTAIDNIGSISPRDRSNERREARCVGLHQMPVIKRRRTQRAIRHQRITGHIADASPPRTLIKPFGVAAGYRIEHQDSPTLLPRDYIHRRH